MQSTALPQPAPPESNGAVDRTVPLVSPPDYDLSYRDDFWPAREYEDRSDRLAIRALLPPTGGDLVDLGAGFGRLADEFRGYRRSTWSTHRRRCSRLPPSGMPAIPESG